MDDDDEDYGDVADEDLMLAFQATEGTIATSSRPTALQHNGATTSAGPGRSHLSTKFSLNTASKPAKVCPPFFFSM